MKRFIVVFLGAFLVGGLAYALVGRASSSATTHEEGIHSAEPHVHEAWASEDVVVREENRLLIEGYAQLENARNVQAGAEARTASERRVLQVRGQEAWAELVTANTEIYHKLRQEVALSGKHAQCTICNGSGRMNVCTLCAHDGKCVSCNGKGIKWHGEVCGACVGTGRCYLCLGSGKLNCLFCNDGEVSLDLPIPPLRMPVEAF